MPLNLKLQHRTILPLHLQISMFVVLSLDAFVGLFVVHDERARISSAAALQKRYQVHTNRAHKQHQKGQKNEAAAPVLTLKTNQGRRMHT